MAVLEGLVDPVGVPPGVELLDEPASLLLQIGDLALQLGHSLVELVNCVVIFVLLLVFLRLLVVVAGVVCDRSLLFDMQTLQLIILF